MSKGSEKHELRKGLYHARPEPWSRADADPKLLAETADRIDFRYFIAALYESEECIPVAEFHIAMSHTGEAYGMARFEEGERGATAVVYAKGSDIEDAAEKMYATLGFGELDLITIDQIYGTFS